MTDIGKRLRARIRLDTPHACDETVDEQREIKRLGAELAAAKAENERLRAENDALRKTLHDELKGNLRLCSLGGARDDETFPTFIERVFSERDAVKALLREVYPYVMVWKLPSDTNDCIHAALGDEL